MLTTACVVFSNFNFSVYIVFFNFTHFILLFGFVAYYKDSCISVQSEQERSRVSIDKLSLLHVLYILFLS